MSDIEQVEANNGDEPVKKVRQNQSELEKFYKFYACTPLRQIIDENESDEQEQQVEEIKQDSTGDQEMLDLSLFSSRFKKSTNNDPTTVAALKAKAQQEKKRLLKIKKKEIEGSLANGGKKYFELAVVYRKASGKMGVRKFKIGKNHELNAFSAPELVQSMEEKFGKILIGHSDFSYDFFLECGGIFNRKFWDINICWGSGTSFDDNLRLTSNELILLSNE